jgi:hypothetical protein
MPSSRYERQAPGLFCGLRSVRLFQGTFFHYLLSACVYVNAQVPVFFSQKQRQAVMDAAELGGLNVLGLINENTAGKLPFHDRVTRDCFSEC